MFPIRGPGDSRRLESKACVRRSSPRALTADVLSNMLLIEEVVHLSFPLGPMIPLPHQQCKPLIGCAPTPQPCSAKGSTDASAAVVALLMDCNFGPSATSYTLSPLARPELRSDADVLLRSLDKCPRRG